MRELPRIRRVHFIIAILAALFLVFAGTDNAYASGENVPGTVVTFYLPDEGAFFDRYWLQIITEPGDMNFNTGWHYAWCTSFSGECDIQINGFPDNEVRYTIGVMRRTCYAIQIVR